jgi:hypothetical protein
MALSPKCGRQTDVDRTNNTSNREKISIPGKDPPGRPWSRCDALGEISGLATPTEGSIQLRELGATALFHWYFSGINLRPFSEA